jgi:hypothetical protein
MIKCLFIGGIADGRWFDVPDTATTWAVEVNVPPTRGVVRQGASMFLDVQRMYYRKERVMDIDHNGQRVSNFVFVPEDGGTLIFQQLIAGYNPKPQGH